MALFLNNVRYTASTTDFKDFYRGTTALGSSINGTEALNGYLEQFSYSDVVLSDDVIIDIYEEGRSKNIYNIFDPIGRINARTIFTGKTNYVTSFTYEAGVNGSTTTKVDTMNNNGKTISYDYHTDGNIKTITQNGKLITYKYNELNELTREDNQVLNKSIVYRYDGGGNLLDKENLASSSL